MTGLTVHQAEAIKYAEASGMPLDPRQADDAAVLLCAEVLIIEEGYETDEAVEAARDDLEWSRSEIPTPYEPRRGAR